MKSELHICFQHMVFCHHLLRSITACLGEGWLIAQEGALKVFKFSKMHGESWWKFQTCFLLQLHTNIKDPAFKGTSGDVYGRNHVVFGFFGGP